MLDMGNGGRMELGRGRGAPIACESAITTITENSAQPVLTRGINCTLSTPFADFHKI